MLLIPLPREGIPETPTFAVLSAAFKQVTLTALSKWLLLTWNLKRKICLEHRGLIGGSS